MTGIGVNSARRLLTVVAVATTVLAGCGVGVPVVTEPACRAHQFPTPFDRVPPCSGPEVLLAAVAGLFAYDPATGVDPPTTFDRVRPLMSAPFQAKAAASVWVLSPVTIVDWNSWVKRGVTMRSEVAITGDDHPPDTATTTARVLSVRLAPANMTPIVFAVYSRAVRVSAESAWLITDLRMPS
ncbi:hypothetical protein ACFWUP_23720 [Nocardia sp. NPDC058658]|uniref:hypothetical protein n=1 Tax=Nocardia sp. NPDC058658 TaxID=3346580 RepID=UPI00364BB56D